MNYVCLFNTPVDKTIACLSDLYSDYCKLKDFVFVSLDSSKLFSVISEKSKVLIKPNWVYNNLTKSDEICLTTHPNLILAVLEYVLLFKPARVIIGDAPVQSCNWTRLLSANFFNHVSALQAEHKVHIQVTDFRKEKWEDKRQQKKNCRSENEYIHFNLSSASLLDPLSVKNKEFCVGDYDPQITAANHTKGIHNYLIAKEAIESDIIINLPKLKTHQKAGLTNGLKNHVGTIGDKAYLAHHSSNLSPSGGDCYPGNNMFRRMSEYLSELSYKYTGNVLYYPFHYFSSVIWRLAPRSDYASLSGSWYGNDTVWRMTLDINKIVRYGSISGEIRKNAQRKIITISDAIICGQGEGPLEPIPLPLGILAISNNDGFLDIIMAFLLKFDYNKIPLLQHFSNEFMKSCYHLCIDNREISIKDLDKYSVKAIPSKGWKGFIEL